MNRMIPDPSNEIMSAQQPSAEVDLLVVGGGINGVGIARDAAGRGLSVALCEKGDLAEGTSSRSGKYIHGGLRYLEYYEFRLVREALIEREVVLEAAPHLSWPLQLILPHSPAQRPRWLIRLGLFLYDNLGGRKRVPASKAVDLSREAFGNSLKDQYRKAFSYWDVWIDDARLVILNAVDAARRGAQILTRHECVSLRREDGVWRAELQDHNAGTIRTLRAKAVINAAGPWVEKVISQSAGINSRLNVRLVKGSHIILPKWWEGEHGFVLQAPDKRLIFVNPYFDSMALVGTTDIPFDGKAENVAIDDGEIRYLLDILELYFEKTFSPSEVLFDYSGVRPLFDDDANKNASAVTRDYEFEIDGALDPEGDRPPILSAFGGKLTTYRKLSEHALEKLAPFFRQMQPSWTANAPLPGGDLGGKQFISWLNDFYRAYPQLPKPLLKHLAHCYGADAHLFLEGVANVTELGEHFGGQFYEKEAEWLMEKEWAQTADDILLRRTKHGLFLTKTQRIVFETWIEDRQKANALIS